MVLALSFSGETEEIIRLLDPIKRLGLPLVSITGVSASALAAASDVALDVSIGREACPLGLAPTASTAAMMALGDALAMAVLERRGFKEEDFARLHPAGRLGKRLLRVESLMHSGDDVPTVGPTTPMPEVIYEISRQGLGMTCVVEDSNKLVGVITDGDLRRLMQKRKKQALDLTARECMTQSPVTIRKTELAASALRLMEERKITSLVVADSEQRLEGVIHLHDLWTTELF